MHIVYISRFEAKRSRRQPVCKMNERAKGRKRGEERGGGGGKKEEKRAKRGKKEGIKINVAGGEEGGGVVRSLESWPLARNER